MLMAECPVCEHCGPHTPSGGGLFTCALCKTSFGTGHAEDEVVVSVGDDGGRT